MKLPWIVTAFGIAWLEKRAAWKAFDRCYGVPYLSEISSAEHHGMLLLERDGKIIRDEGFTGLHWHRKP